MKFDELIELAKKPEGPNCGDDILAGMKLILTAEDLSANDKGGFATGFLMGLAYTLAMFNQGRIPEAAQTLIQLQGEWEAHGVI